MFLSEVSADGVGYSSLTVGQLSIISRKAPCLQINGLLIRDAEYRSHRPLDGSSACGRERTSILGNSIVETERCRPWEQQPEIRGARQREAVRPMLRFCDAAVERANTAYAAMALEFGDSARRHVAAP
jgi:hypothetical protein